MDNPTEPGSFGQPEMVVPVGVDDTIADPAATTTVVSRSKAAFVRRIVKWHFSDPQKNLLLASLPEREYSELLPHLALVSLDTGTLLHAGTADRPVIFFPTDAIVSVLHLIRDGRSVEVAVIGNEGLVGLSSLMGGRDSVSEAVVQYRGWAYRIPSEVLRRSFNRCLSMQGMILRYAQSLYLQSAQTAVCIRHHSVLQQFVRRLLLGLDRSASATLAMTHQAMAARLGVRRESVTEAAGKLHTLGLIDYRRGRVVVLDRTGLERQCCECYDVERQAADRLRPALTVAI
jgi:CRP-like cAMP-binding protein